MVEGEAGAGLPAVPHSARRGDHSTRERTASGARPQLALFAKLPRAGEVKTRLVPPLTPSQAATLALAFLEDTAATLERVTSTERTLYLVPHTDGEACARLLPSWRHAWQGEGDLGRRLESALAELHERGSPVVIVGADHPDLSGVRVREALAALMDHDVVLGPTPDGGYYLVGTRAVFPGLLEGIEWSTPRVAEQTRARAVALGLSVMRLATAFDVDTPEDLSRLRARLAGRPEGAPRTARTLEALPH